MTHLSQIISERENLIYTLLPLGVFRNSGEWPVPVHNHALFLYTNDESDRILEWICYHKRIGISHFYIYSRHQQPETFYEKLIPFTNGDNPLVTYHYYPEPGNDQLAFYHYFHHYGHQSQWTMILNIDEFLCLKHHATLADLLQFHHTSEAIYFNICPYGHNDHDVTPDGDILLNYTRRSETLSPQTRVFIKNRSIPYTQILQHSTTPFKSSYFHLDPELKSINILGNDLSKYFENYPSSANLYLKSQQREQQILNTAFIAHFGIPSRTFLKHSTPNDSTEKETYYFYSGDRIPDIHSQQELNNYYEAINAVEDDFLQNKWANYLTSSLETSVFPFTFWDLLSEGKMALQSSTANPVESEQDAARLVNGQLTGKAQNCTETEADPWWLVDLESQHIIHEIHIFNRLDQNIRDAVQFELYLSDDGEEWILIDAKETPYIFGGMDGTPYVWTSEEGQKGRFVKLLMPGENRVIALDQIQVFGE